MRLLIVNFHYFGEKTYPSGIYPISPSTFKKQVETLARSYRFISQAELAERFHSRVFPDGDHCLLTFDDGLKEQMAAFEWLKSRGIPAVFYVPTDPIRHRTVLDVHRLHHVRAHCDDATLFEMLDASHCISHFDFDELALAQQYRYDARLARRIKYFLNFELAPEEKDLFIRQAFGEVVADEAAFSDSFYMGRNDLQTLADAEALGSHGASHRPLARLSPAEAGNDIRDSIRLLEEWTGRAMTSFSYPFGGATAVNETLAPMFAGTSIRFALTMKRGMNEDQDFDQPLFLKRMDTNDAPGGKNSEEGRR